jgi:AraC-like DNA-binding protein
MNDRSVRRTIRQQGLSYRGLLDELRTQIAPHDQVSNDDIALALGFSDAANFRRALHRWTNKAPSDIRAE